MKKLTKAKLWISRQSIQQKSISSIISQHQPSCFVSALWCRTCLSSLSLRGREPTAQRHGLLQCHIRQPSSMLDSSILHLHNLTRQFAFRSNHKHLLWSTSSLRLIGSCSTWNSAWPGTIFNWRRGPPFTFRLWWFEYVDTAIWQSQCKLVGFRRMSGNNKRMYPQAVLIN